MTIIWLIVLAASLYVLIKAADYLTDASEKIGTILRLPAFVVGLLIVTFGTTSPELLTSIFAVIEKEAAIVSSNIIGTIVANIFLGLGLAVIISKKTARFHWDSVSNDMPFLLGAVLLLALTIYDGLFTFWEAIIFLAAYAIYVFYALHIRRINPKEIRQDLNREIKSKFRQDFKAMDVEKITAKKVVKLMAIFFAALVMMVLAAKYTVDSLISLAYIIGIGTSTLAATIIAVGTSLPEISVAITSAKKGHFDIVIGNILGACIFDTFIIFGMIGLFSNIAIPAVVINLILPVAIGAILIQWLVTMDKKITVTEGMLMVLLYITFVAKLFNIF